MEKCNHMANNGNAHALGLLHILFFSVVVDMRRNRAL